VIDVYAGEALRVLVLAYRDFDKEQDWENDDLLATDLTLLVIVGIQVKKKKKNKDLFQSINQRLFLFFFC
jgi:magnesium-transporting ATPase (P-type)